MQNFIILEEDAIKLGELLKEKRKENNLTITDIEAKSGINRADIHRLEGGQKKRLNPFQLVSLADVLDINLIDLFILAGFINKKAITDFVKKKTDERISEQLKIISYTGAIKIPIYENFLEGLGFVDNVTPCKYTTLFLNEYSEYVGIIINDGTLRPLISENAIVILEKNKSLNNGDIGVFGIDDKILVRKYFKKENGTILYYDDSSHEPIIAESDTLKIYGKIVITINELR